MAITLEANYAKKLGLPNYSSHQYSVTIRTELTDLSQVAAESARLYQVLQDAVDHEIQHVGFMPDASTYGMHPSASDRHPPGNGSNGKTDRASRNGRGSHHSPPDGDGSWRCSEKQRGLIENIVEEHRLDKRDVEAVAVEMFGLGVKLLNKLQASGLIAELLERNTGDRRQPRQARHRESTRPNGGRR